MASARPWTFTQLGGDKFVLKLDGPNAPFGRPRRSAVAKKKREVRQSATYYAGNSVPDRHVFGDKQAAIVLTGRFMDSRIGSSGGARAMADRVDSFVAAQVEVRGEWGGILAVTGLLTEFEAAYESEEEIVWTLTLEVNSDDTLPILAPAPPPTSVSDLLNSVIGQMEDINSDVKELPPDIEYAPGFLDDLATLISDVNSVTGTLSSFADSVDNYESTLHADAQRFKAGMLQAGTSIEKLQITLGIAQNDDAVASASSASQVSWFVTSANMEANLLQMLAWCAEAILITEIALQGQPDRTIIAESGDTWESLSGAYLGGASRADDLRQANGVRYGSGPTAGQTVHIPKSA